MDQAQGLRNIISQQQKPKSQARVITITSGKGGVGKSNIAVNLALHLSRHGKRVVIIDADFGLANIEIMLGIKPKYNLADLIFRGKSLKEIITRGPEGIGFISGGSGIKELTNLNKNQVSFLIHKLYELDEIADIILIDTGAGITDMVLDFVSVSSEVILITTPEPTSITDSYSLLKTLNRKSDFSHRNTSIKLLTNRVETRKEGRDLYEKIRTVSNTYLNIPIEFLGAIPLDVIVSRSVIRQKPATILYPGSSFVRAVSDISDKLHSEDLTTSSGDRGIANLFANLMRKIR